MKKSHQMLRLLELTRGTLPAKEAQELKSQIADSPEMEREFDESAQLFKALSQLAEKKATVSDELSKEVLQTIKQNNPAVEGYMTTQKSTVSAFLESWKLRVIILLASAAYIGYLYRHSIDQNFLLYIEGSFSALLMIASALLSFVLVFFRRYTLSAAFITCACFIFINRSMTSTFFNDSSIENLGAIYQGPGQAAIHTQPIEQKRAKGGRAIVYNDARIVESTQGLSAQIGKIIDRMNPVGSGESGAPKKADSLSTTNLLPSTLPEQKSREIMPLAAGGVSDKALAFAPPQDFYPVPNENREQYGEYEENPRFDPQTTPLSTFSIDVDTGSYTNMRRFISQGQLPPAHAVRLEEFVNYFDYSYQGSTAEPFAVNFEVAPSPIDTEYHLLKVGIKARDIAQNNERGWNVVFLIDTSGSMSSADKLPLVKESLKVLANNMRAHDKIAIVTYAGSAGILLESTPGNEKAKINSAIDSLGAGGSTNGSGGIELAYQVAQKNFIKGSTNRVVLATDGDFNVGISSFDQLMNLIEKKRATGITLTTLGFGQGNIQERSMEQLANRGNGNYFYIDSYREARKVLETGLMSTMEVVAKDVKLQMEFNPAVVKQYRLIGFDNRKLNREDFTNDAKDAGEIGSGHTVTALYEIVLNDSPLAKKLDQELRYKREEKPAAPVSEEQTRELGFLKIRYKAPESDVSTPLSFPITRDLTKAQGSNDFNFAASVAYFGEILRQSKFLGNYSVNDVIAVAKKSKGEDSSGLRAEFIKLAEDAQSLLKANNPAAVPND